MSECAAKLVRAALAAGEGSPVPATPAALYLDLAEEVVRQSSAWQLPDGTLGDPYNAPGVASVTATARYAAALGHLLRAGRCADLLPSATRAMGWGCTDLTRCLRAGEQWFAASFNLKDLFVLYGALADLVPAATYTRWTEQLAAYRPEEVYYGERNWAFYSAAAEAQRVHYGLSDRWDYVDAQLDSQWDWWTRDGLYRDPDDPVTYDLTARQALALVLAHGYAGQHGQRIRELLHQGALANLLFVSPTGVAPYGGRSNQFHIQEAMIAYLAEWQAGEAVRQGDLRLAGALRRMALAGAVADAAWLRREPFICLKQCFGDATGWGHDAYNPGSNLHTSYGLLAANLFAGAWHLAEQSILPRAMPADVGGYVFWLEEGYHRLWATAGPYHVQLDLRAQPGQDATGLGRFHRQGAPLLLGPHASVAAQPKYLLPVDPAPRAVALGVGWPAGGDWYYLAAAGRDTHDVTVQPLGRPDPVAFEVSYTALGGGLGGQAVVVERYELSRAGLRCAVRAPGAPRLRLQVPLLETDGEVRTTVELQGQGVAVHQGGRAFRLRVTSGAATASLEPWAAPNRNGLYRVAVFEVTGDQVAYEATLD